jgi:hypothetical protein
MRVSAIAVTAVLLLAGCSDEQTGPRPGAVNQPSTSTSTSSASASSATPTVDPYETYLAHIPKGEPTLSREDASTRALLGCDRTWPPGTTDAVLHQAYAAYCK